MLDPGNQMTHVLAAETLMKHMFNSGTQMTDMPHTGTEMAHMLACMTLGLR